MKANSYFPATVATLGLFFFTSTLPANAEASGQVNASVEIYELSQPQAFAVQKTFAGGSNEERSTRLLNLRKGTSANGIKTIAVGQRSCLTGESSQVSSLKEYRYPTEFDVRSGFSVPSAFECRNIGCTMALTVSADKEGFYSVKTDISNVSLINTSHYSASKADQRGSIEQPNFANEQIKTQIRLTAGVPKLVGTYSPFKDDSRQGSLKDPANKAEGKNDTTSNVLRLVFVTVELEK